MTTPVEWTPESRTGVRGGQERTGEREGEVEVGTGERQVRGWRDREGKKTRVGDSPHPLGSRLLSPPSTNVHLLYLDKREVRGREV